jgi:hypothetical protein
MYLRHLPEDPEVIFHKKTAASISLLSEGKMKEASD